MIQPHNPSFKLSGGKRSFCPITKAATRHRIVKCVAFRVIHTVNTIVHKITVKLIFSKRIARLSPAIAAGLLCKVPELVTCKLELQISPFSRCAVARQNTSQRGFSRRLLISKTLFFNRSYLQTAAAFSATINHHRLHNGFGFSTRTPKHRL